MLHSDHDWSPIGARAWTRFASKKCRIQIAQTGFSGINGIFIPLTAPLPIRDLPLRATAPRLFFSDISAPLVCLFGPLRSVFRSALLLCSCLCQCHVCVTCTSAVLPGTIILTVATKDMYQIAGFGTYVPNCRIWHLKFQKNPTAGGGDPLPHPPAQHGL